MSSKVLLTFSDDLKQRIDEDKAAAGASRSGVVMRILERHYREEDERRRLYDAWFAAEVERGLASLRDAPLHDHEDVMREIDALLEGKKRADDAPEMV